MEIKVINNVPNIKVTVNQSEDGSFAILLAEDNKTTLGSVKPGSVVKLGNREYIVLGHGAETTAIIAKDFVKEMRFGDTGDYVTSDVREFCNGEFLNELAAAVGIDNIVEHGRTMHHTVIVTSCFVVWMNLLNLYLMRKWRAHNEKVY